MCVFLSLRRLSSLAASGSLTVCCSYKAWLCHCHVEPGLVPSYLSPVVLLPHPPCVSLLSSLSLSSLSPRYHTDPYLLDRPAVVSVNRQGTWAYLSPLCLPLPSFSPPAVTLFGRTLLSGKDWRKGHSVVAAARTHTGRNGLRDETSCCECCTIWP